MSVAGIVLIVVMLFCIIVGIPISWSLLLASAASLLVDGSALSILSQRLFTSMDSFSMLAVPLFLVAGDIMAQGSISRRLVTFADSIFGSIRGGLCHLCCIDWLSTGHHSGHWRHSGPCHD